MTPSERKLLVDKARELAMQSRYAREAARRATSEKERRRLYAEAEALLDDMYHIYDQLAVAEPDPA